MKGLPIILFTILTSLSCLGQDWDKELRQELFNALITSADSIYISDRKQLERITGYDCSNRIVTFKYMSKDGNKIEIKIEQGLFDPSQHKLDLTDTVYKHLHGQKRVDYLVGKNLIDNKRAYGIDGWIPETEIKNLTIKWNMKELTIPNTAYSDLYEPTLCRDYLQVESFLTKGHILYIYISGSDGIGSYSVKFVFNTKEYLTRIIGTNEMTDGFDFLDGTAKVED